jgi:hypothetical protein
MFLKALIKIVSHVLARCDIIPPKIQPENNAVFAMKPVYGGARKQQLYFS